MMDSLSEENNEEGIEWDELDPTAEVVTEENVICIDQDKFGGFGEKEQILFSFSSTTVEGNGTTVCTDEEQVVNSSIMITANKGQGESVNLDIIGTFTSDCLVEDRLKMVESQSVFSEITIDNTVVSSRDKFSNYSKGEHIDNSIPDVEPGVSNAGLIFKVLNDTVIASDNDLQGSQGDKNVVTDQLEEKSESKTEKNEVNCSDISMQNNAEVYKNEEVPDNDEGGDEADYVGDNSKESLDISIHDDNSQVIESNCEMETEQHAVNHFSEEISNNSQNTPSITDKEHDDLSESSKLIACDDMEGIYEETVLCNESMDSTFSEDGYDSTENVLNGNEIRNEETEDLDNDQEIEKPTTVDGLGRIENNNIFDTVCDQLEEEEESHLEDDTEDSSKIIADETQSNETLESHQNAGLSQDTVENTVLNPDSIIQSEETEPSSRQSEYAEDEDSLQNEDLSSRTDGFMTGDSNSGYGDNVDHLNNHETLVTAEKPSEHMVENETEISYSEHECNDTTSVVEPETEGASVSQMEVPGSSYPDVEKMESASSRHGQNTKEEIPNDFKEEEFISEDILENKDSQVLVENDDLVLSAANEEHLQEKGENLHDVTLNNVEVQLIRKATDLEKQEQRDDWNCIAAESAEGENKTERMEFTAEDDIGEHNGDLTANTQLQCDKENNSTHIDETQDIGHECFTRETQPDYDKEDYSTESHSAKNTEQVEEEHSDDFSTETHLQYDKEDYSTELHSAKNTEQVEEEHSNDFSTETHPQYDKEDYSTELHLAKNTEQVEEEHSNDFSTETHPQYDKEDYSTLLHLAKNTEQVEEEHSNDFSTETHPQCDKEDYSTELHLAKNTEQVEEEHSNDFSTETHPQYDKEDYSTQLHSAKNTEQVEEEHSNQFTTEAQPQYDKEDYSTELHLSRNTEQGEEEHSNNFTIQTQPQCNKEDDSAQINKSRTMKHQVAEYKDLVTEMQPRYYKEGNSTQINESRNAELEVEGYKDLTTEIQTQYDKEDDNTQINETRETEQEDEKHSKNFAPETEAQQDDSLKTNEEMNIENDSNYSLDPMEENFEGFEMSDEEQEHDGSGADPDPDDSSYQPDESEESISQDSINSSKDEEEEDEDDDYDSNGQSCDENNDKEENDDEERVVDENTSTNDANQKDISAGEGNHDQNSKTDSSELHFKKKRLRLSLEDLEDTPLSELLKKLKESKSSSKADEPLEKKRYHCSYCGESFSRQVTKESHEREHQMLYKCVSCHLTFQTHLKLLKHRAEVHNEFPYFCSFCSTNCASVHSWHKHMKTKHVRCSKCKSYFNNLEDMKNHKCLDSGEFEPDPNGIQCDLPINDDANRILYDFPDPKKPRGRPKKPNQKEGLEGSGDPNKALKKGLNPFKRFKLGEDGTLVSDPCTSNSDVTSSKPADDNNSRPGQFVCSQCNMRFENKSSLICHQALTHPRQPVNPAKPRKTVLVCRFCLTFFDTQADMTQHMCPSKKSASLMLNNQLKNKGSGNVKNFKNIYTPPVCNPTMLVKSSDKNVVSVRNPFEPAIEIKKEKDETDENKSCNKKSENLSASSRIFDLPGVSVKVISKERGEVTDSSVNKHKQANINAKLLNIPQLSKIKSGQNFRFSNSNVNNKNSINVPTKPPSQSGLNMRPANLHPSQQNHPVSSSSNISNRNNIGITQSNSNEQFNMQNRFNSSHYPDVRIKTEKDAESFDSQCNMSNITNRNNDFSNTLPGTLLKIPQVSVKLRPENQSTGHINSNDNRNMHFNMPSGYNFPPPPPLKMRSEPPGLIKHPSSNYSKSSHNMPPRFLGYPQQHMNIRPEYQNNMYSNNNMSSNDQLTKSYNAAQASVKIKAEPENISRSDTSQNGGHLTNYHPGFYGYQEQQMKVRPENQFMNRNFPYGNMPHARFFTPPLPPLKSRAELQQHMAQKNFYNSDYLAALHFKLNNMHQPAPMKMGMQSHYLGMRPPYVNKTSESLSPFQTGFNGIPQSVMKLKAENMEEEPKNEFVQREQPITSQETSNIFDPSVKNEFVQREQPITSQETSNIFDSSVKIKTENKHSNQTDNTDFRVPPVIKSEPDIDTESLKQQPVDFNLLNPSILAKFGLRQDTSL